MLCDLHIHSYNSDGTWSPEKIASVCKEKQIRIFSITDHNLLSAYPEAIHAADKYGLQCIIGVEIDCILNGKSFHVLGYNVDPSDKPLLKLLKTARMVLDQMSDRLIQAIEQNPFDSNHPVSMEDYLSYHYDLSRGGWKGLNYLIDRNLAHDFDSAMSLYGRYHISYEKSSFPSMEDTCNAILQAGGIPVLAHPSNYFDEDDFLEQNLSETVQAGVQGIECFYPAQSPQYTQRCVDFCNAHQLYITCGGDSHGTFQTEIDNVGYYIGSASVDQSNLKLWF